MDLQGYGAGVVTTGYGLGIGPVRPEDRAYTACFDGTSSASATVAGAVAALQGLAIDATGSPATSAAMRAALVATGEPQAGPAEERIGPRPRSPPPPPCSARSGLRPARACRPRRRAQPSVQAPPPSREQAVPRPAARGAQARLDRRAGTLTITLRGLAPRAVVFAAGRVRVAAGGRIVLPVLTPRRFVLVVAAPRRAGSPTP